MKIGRVELPSGDVALASISDSLGTVQVIEGAAEDALVEVCLERRAPDPTGPQYGIENVRFLPPVARPPSIRDFMAFEEHVKNARSGVGLSVDPEWYDAPVFYFSNPNAVLGDGDSVRPPRQSRSLDYELEVACLIGRRARDLDPADPAGMACIAGFLLMNDWSARDFGAKEMKQGLGPAKAKDFATSLGPWVVTPDEFAWTDPGRLAERATARVNGKLYSEGALAAMHFSWLDILARASADVDLVPGDIIGSGTCGGGCILELRILHGREEYPWLRPGDVVELESPLMGRLRNPIEAP
jgi:fumarylacetoacetate (FAA) hydrolase